MSDKRKIIRVIVVSASIEALGLKPVYETFNKLGLPKDPPLQNEILPFDLPGIVGRIQRVLGLNIFLNFYISEDIRDTTRNMMMVSVTGRAIRSIKFYKHTTISISALSTNSDSFR